MTPRVRTWGPGVMALFLLGLFASCSDSGQSGRILAVDAEGAVIGFVYLDRDGNGVQDVTDDPLPGLGVSLFVAGTQSLAAVSTTDANGLFAMDGVPVGGVRIEADTTLLGDSLSVIPLANSDLTLHTGDTLSVTMGVTFPSFTLAEARTLPEGTKAFTEGIVLNSGASFPDGSVHLQSGGTFLRVIGTPRTLFPGDSVRILGRAASEEGQPIWREGEAFVLAPQSALPLPLETLTATAATADGGLKDAALVRIRGADIVDTMSVTTAVGRDLHVTVDDGSGPVEMVLLELGGFNLGQIHPDSFSVREALGLLVPTQSDVGVVSWRLVPRTNADLVVDPLPFPGLVTNLTIVGVTNSTVTLNWTEVDDGLGSPSSYTARIRPSSTLVWTDVTSGTCASPISGTTIGEVTSCTVDGLTAATIYFVEVRSFRGTLGVDAIFGPQSNTAGGTTLP